MAVVMACPRFVLGPMLQLWHCTICLDSQHPVTQAEQLRNRLSIGGIVMLWRGLRPL